jgi:hypothetical protein
MTDVEQPSLYTINIKHLSSYYNVADSSSYTIGSNEEEPEVSSECVGNNSFDCDDYDDFYYSKTYNKFINSLLIDNSVDNPAWESLRELGTDSRSFTLLLICRPFFCTQFEALWEVNYRGISENLQSDDEINEAIS